MKKVIAIILSMIMAFSVFYLPVSAQETEVMQETEVQTLSEVDESFETVDHVLTNVQLVLETVVEIIKAVHELVGTILSMFGEVCPMCGEMHDISADIDTPTEPDEPAEPDSTEISAEEYYKNNSQLLDIIKVEESEDILSENEVGSFLEKRGFGEYQVTYSYSIDGEYGDSTVISESSEDKHPTYQTIYVSENGEAWIIDIVNGAVFANPFDFNIDSDLGVQVLFSETEDFTSYDSETNSFFITIPNESEVHKIVVDSIDAETLDTFTIEEICRITGATVSEQDEEEKETANLETEEQNIVPVSMFSLRSLNNNSPATISEASENSDPFIVVSLGDSFSSGEGIDDFYGHDLPLAERVQYEDWLAHRSENSWPGLLKIPGITEDNKTLADYRTNGTNSNIQWYFGAVSGAKTKDFDKRKQPKPYYKTQKQSYNSYKVYQGTAYLPKQLDYLQDVCNNVQGDIDYVTLTLGGNDVDFTGVVMSCAVNSSYLNVNLFAKDLKKLLADLTSEDNMKIVKNNLLRVYESISNIAPTADILVAGYPKLFNSTGSKVIINEDEANTVNEKVSYFNDVIEGLIKEYDNQKIHFVDVEDKFDENGGHSAYSKEAWINPIDIGPKTQDINAKDIASAYSMHPNKKGAEAYAECVNAKIAEIEGNKHKGTLAGRICKASDRTTPITEARVEIVAEDSCLYLRPDSNGNYSQPLVAGEYPVTVTADGYIDFHAYATIEKDLTTYMETFLMVEGEEGDIGSAIGKITNAMTGNGVGDVKLDVRSGWNNTDKGDILTTVTTNASGDYIVTLPIGNYTLIASKDGFVSNTVNIVVQKDMSTLKNGSITPIISGNKFRVVLTWGASPSDLDSHVVGKLSNGNQFHVYFSDKSEYDGSVEVCNLDVDDTTSYGPETITLNTTTDNPYYYYIHRWSDHGLLATSNAQINLYQGENLVATFNVPTDQAEGRYWNVFAIKNGELIVNNTITSSPNVTY